MNSQPPEVSQSIECCLEEFDRIWHSGNTPVIDDFLPSGFSDSDGAARHRLLVELVMIDQEYRWRRGAPGAAETSGGDVCETVAQSSLPERPSLEDYACRYPELGKFEQLPTRLLKNEYRILQRWGNRPNPADYLARFPNRLDRLLPELARLESHSPATLPADALHVCCPHCHAAIDLTDGDLRDVSCPSCCGRFNLLGEDAEGDRVGRRLGRFELLERIGAGNFGTVWRARDEELKRDVALKVPRRGQLTAEQTEQFLREARAAAQVRHANIVSVHEVGRDGDTVYIVSDFVRGLTLADWLADQKLAAREAADLCAKVADALHYAHEAGVIHRDLKPGNIMLDADGQPHIMDFGLARREAGEVTMTVDGKVLGTPAYMSPEQAKGEGHQADRRSDVYSLGVILFELLAGERPFRGNIRMMLHHVIHDEPPSPRRLNGHTPIDLETICLKCLEKDPQSRYGSAGELGDDLRRFLMGQPVVARPISRAARAWRWCKRNPMGAIAAALLFVLAAGGPLVAVREAIHRSREARAKEAARRSLYLSDMIVAQEAWQSANLRRVTDLLRPYEQPGPGQEDLRRFAWYYLSRLCQRGREAPALDKHTGYVWGVAYSPDGKTLAMSSADGTVRLWDVATRTERLKLNHGGVALAVAFSADGSTLASGGGGGVKLWDPVTGALRQDISSSAALGVGLAFASGGKLAASSLDGSVTIWDLHTGESRTVFNSGGHAVWSLACSRRGNRLAIGLADGTIKLRDMESEADWQTLPGHTSWVRSLAFSPDGMYLASASHDHTVGLWDAATGEHLATFEHRDRAWSVAFSPDSKTLASAGNLVKLWDVETRTEKDLLIGHEQMVYAVAFSPNAKTLATGGHDTIVKLWDLTAPIVRDTLESHTGTVWDVAVSHDGKTLASASEDGTIRLWDAATGQWRKTLPGHANWVMSVVFSPDDQTLASAGDDGSIKLWDVQSGKELDVHLKGHTEPVPLPVFDLDFSPDGKTLASAGNDRTVRLWDVTTGEETAVLTRHAEIVWAVAFSPDGRMLASGSDDTTIKLWDVDSLGVVDTLTGHTSVVNSVAFSRDGRFLASGSGDGTVKLWDVKARSEPKTLIGHTGIVWSVSFSPDGKTLASSSHDATIKLWDLAGGLEPETLIGHTSAVQSVVFSPDGNTLISGSGDRTVRIWRTRF